MFTNASGCQLVGYDYTDKHGHRLALHLLPIEGPPQFRVAFTSIAAYRIDRDHLGSLILSVKHEPLENLIQDWDRVVAAQIAGTWPGPTLTDCDAATDFALSAGLRGFRIALDSGHHVWAIGRDFVLLGQRSEYPSLRRPAA
jgi:hypothetical protein